MLGLAGEHRTNLDTLYGRLLNDLCDGLGNLLTGSHDELTSIRMNDIVNADTTEDALVERRDGLVAILQGGADQATQRATVFLVDDDVVRDVNETTRQVTGVGRLHGGVGQTLTGTVGRDEVLQHRHTLLEVRENRVLNGTASLSTGLLRLGHQTTHTGELTNLVLRTTGTGVEHHEYGVESLVGLGHLLHQHGAEVIINMCPCIDNLVVTLGIGNEAHVVVLSNLAYLLVTLLNEVLLGLRNDDVVKVERQASLVSHAVTQVLNAVKELASLSEAHVLDDVGNDVTQRLL